MARSRARSPPASCAMASADALDRAQPRHHRHGDARPMSELVAAALALALLVALPLGLLVARRPRARAAVLGGGLGALQPADAGGLRAAGAGAGPGLLAGAGGAGHLCRCRSCCARWSPAWPRVPPACWSRRPGHGADAAAAAVAGGDAAGPAGAARRACASPAVTLVSAATVARLYQRRRAGHADPDRAGPGAYREDPGRRRAGHARWRCCWMRRSARCSAACRRCWPDGDAVGAAAWLGANPGTFLGRGRRPPAAVAGRPGASASASPCRSASRWRGGRGWRRPPSPPPARCAPSRAWRCWRRCCRCSASASRPRSSRWPCWRCRRCW